MKSTRVYLINTSASPSIKQGRGVAVLIEPSPLFGLQGSGLAAVQSAETKIVNRSLKFDCPAVPASASASASTLAAVPSVPSVSSAAEASAAAAGTLPAPTPTPPADTDTSAASSQLTQASSDLVLDVFDLVQLVIEAARNKTFSAHEAQLMLQEFGKIVQDVKSISWFCGWCLPKKAASASVAASSVAATASVTPSATQGVLPRAIAPSVAPKSRGIADAATSLADVDPEMTCVVSASNLVMLIIAAAQRGSLSDDDLKTLKRELAHLVVQVEVAGAAAGCGCCVGAAASAKTSASAAALAPASTKPVHSRSLKFAADPASVLEPESASAAAAPAVSKDSESRRPMPLSALKVLSEPKPCCKGSCKAPKTATSSCN